MVVNMAIVGVYLYMLGLAVWRRQRNAIVALIVSPVFLYIFFGPR